MIWNGEEAEDKKTGQETVLINETESALLGGRENGEMQHIKWSWGGICLGACV